MNLPVCDPCLLGQERSACTQLQGASGKPQSATTPLGATTRCRVLLLAGTHGNALPRRRLPHLASVHRASGQGAFTTTAPPNFERARCCGACRLGKNPAPRRAKGGRGGSCRETGKASSAAARAEHQPDPADHPPRAADPLRALSSRRRPRQSVVVVVVPPPPLLARASFSFFTAALGLPPAPVDASVSGPQAAARHRQPNSKPSLPVLPSLPRRQRPPCFITERPPPVPREAPRRERERDRQGVQCSPPIRTPPPLPPPGSPEAVLLLLLLLLQARWRRRRSRRRCPTWAPGR